MAEAQRRDWFLEWPRVRVQSKEGWLAKDLKILPGALGGLLKGFRSVS